MFIAAISLSSEIHWRYVFILNTFLSDLIYQSSIQWWTEFRLFYLQELFENTGSFTVLLLYLHCLLQHPGTDTIILIMCYTLPLLAMILCSVMDKGSLYFRHYYITPVLMCLYLDSLKNIMCEKHLETVGFLKTVWSHGWLWLRELSIVLD